MSSIENKEIKLKTEQNVLYNSMRNLIDQNSKIQLNQEEYNKQYENLKNQYEKNNEKLIKLENTKLEWKVKKQKTLELLDRIKNQDKLITDFDEQMWYSLIERVIVNRDGTLKFELKNGQILS